MAVARPAASYRESLAALLPSGLAWPRDLDSVLQQLMAATAEEFARIDVRVVDLLDEADPRTTYELLGDWERVLELPDDCTPAGASIEARRAQVVQKLTATGGNSRAYFIELVTALGYAMAPSEPIREFQPFTCASPCNAGLYGAMWDITWQVRVADAILVQAMTCASPCNAGLRDYGDTVLECVIRRLKPAHTLVLFEYGAT